MSFPQRGSWLWDREISGGCTAALCSSLCSTAKLLQAALSPLGHKVALSPFKMRCGLSYYLLSPSSSCWSPPSDSSAEQPSCTGKAAYRLLVSEQTKSRTPVSLCKLIPPSADVSEPSLPNYSSLHIIPVLSVKFPPHFSLMPQLRGNRV